MSIQIIERPAEVAREPGEDIWHIVCHCTDDRIAACGNDSTNDEWAHPDDIVCSLCMLAWPDDAPTCPWGCSCEEECGPEDGAA